LGKSAAAVLKAAVHAAVVFVRNGAETLTSSQISRTPAQDIDPAQKARPTWFLK